MSSHEESADSDERPKPVTRLEKIAHLEPELSEKLTEFLSIYKHFRPIEALAARLEIPISDATYIFLSVGVAEAAERYPEDFERLHPDFEEHCPDFAKYQPE